MTPRPPERPTGVDPELVNYPCGGAPKFPEPTVAPKIRRTFCPKCGHFIHTTDPVPWHRIRVCNFHRPFDESLPLGWEHYAISPVEDKRDESRP